MSEKYIIGTKPVPEWCAKRLTPFRKADGSTGIEFYGDKYDINLNVGDVLILRNNGYIEFKRSGANARGTVS